MEWLNEYHLGGIAIGICTFLIIGLFHPVVVKAEYYWGTRCWWIFLVLGIAGIIGTVLISDILISSLLGVFSFSSLFLEVLPTMGPHRAAKLLRGASEQKGSHIPS